MIEKDYCPVHSAAEKQKRMRNTQTMAAWRYITENTILTS